MINSVKACRLLFVLLTFFVSHAYAQKTKIYTDKYALYREALELYDKEKFSVAQEKFQECIRLVADKHDEVSINSEFYSALCALKLYHPDAEFLLQKFITDHPESPQVRTVYMHLGRHFFNNRKWKKSIEYFNMVDRYDLTAKEISEYYYKKGYAYFQMKDFNSAALNFIEIKDVENDYREPALYYYSHIAYQDKNYQTALEGFEKLKASETFKSLVPYYVSQIYYLQGKYERVVIYVPPILDTAKGNQKTELAHLVGDSYYRLQKYDIAVPYLEQYLQGVVPTREENYQMGYAYYRSGFQSKAIPYLNRATNVKDAMGQLALYHLADCYIKTNEKTYARNAYAAASELDFDKKIQEDALFSYAKLAYELSYNPFHEAIKALQQYLDKYPNSSKKDEAYSFLINVYMTTRNYQAAQEALEKVKNKDFRYQSAYQMVSFNRGVDLFLNAKYNEAIASFEKVKLYPIDKKLNAESKYWIAESYFKQRNFSKSIEAYGAFQQEPGAFSSKYYNWANYNTAYAWYEQGMDVLQRQKSMEDQGGYLANSLYAFKKFVSDKSESDKMKLVDASLRIGDLYYFRKENENAVDAYAKAYELNLGSRDYALFQMAHCRHLLRKHNEAIETYSRLMREFPTSNFVSSATLEIGNIYREIENNPKGIEYYQLFITRYPNNQDVRLALRYLGLLYFKQKDYAKAESHYRRLLTEFNSTQDIKAALDGLKAVYTAQGREDEWVALAKQYDKAGTTDGDIEIVYWTAAEDAYNSADCEKTIEKTNRYIQQFPNGNYITSAHFYRAECNYSKGNKDLSIADYEYVFGKSGHSYREVTSQRLASMAFAKKDYENSNKYYLELEKVASSNASFQEAYLGLMRGFYLTKKHENAIAYANKVLKESTISPDLKSEANFIIGMSQLALQDYQNAFNSLKTTTDITKSGWRWAEARYNMCLIYFLKMEHKKCEKEIMNFTKAKPNYDYWIAKSYILLGENYLALGDAFQAKATLKSVIDNYVGDDDIVATAKAKYDAIVAQENGLNQQRQMEKQNASGTEIENSTNENE